MGGSTSGRRTRGRRIITRVIVFLLLGAIVNVAVAWGCYALELRSSPGRSLPLTAACRAV